MNDTSRKPPPVRSLMAAALLAAVCQSGASETPAPPEVLDTQEAADLLRVGRAELARMADAQAIPARRVGREWRFSRTAVMAWLAGQEPVAAVQAASGDEKSLGAREAKPVAGGHPRQPVEVLAQAELANTAGRGTDAPAAEDKAGPKKPEAIGEKSQTKTAEEVFLRDQAVLLKPRQVTLELDFLYSRNENNNLIPTRVNELDTSVSQAEAKTDVFLSNFSVRYGVFDNLQWFAGIPVSRQSQTLSQSSQDLSKTSTTRWGFVTSGLRYAALAEGPGYPGVILSVDGSFPTDERAYGVGGSAALTKSIDPAVLFFNVGYRHFFNDKHYNPARLASDDQLNVSAGIAYALNDTLTLSTSLSGAFLSRSRLREGYTLPSRELYSLRLSVTSYLMDGLYAEPYVNFGLNGGRSDLTIGLSLPYTFSL